MLRTTAMAHDIQLPCDGEGACMRCKATPPAEETLTCCTCATPWHVLCLSAKPETLASALQWECPDCSGDAPAAPAVAGAGGTLLAAIRAIEADQMLTDKEKAAKRQELLSGKMEDEKKGTDKEGGDDVLDVLDESFKCCFCMQLPERPVTTPCGHNFCLKCFQRWAGKWKATCAKCRAPIPKAFASHPRINSAVVAAIRMSRLSKSAVAGNVPKAAYHFVHNQNRPDQAFTTERAKKTGKANACSGKVFVTIPADYFGPILAEHDPVRNQGVVVGESWEDRLTCRQWGAHFPHVAGIAGQAKFGSQSVALSGGYEDDEDHGEWFLYTGSGGRDLSGNKRTNKKQSFDQTFEKMNEALRVSCKKGYPVRVVRSHKEKRSSYAPQSGVRYDGVYRIQKCWRKVGIQGFKVCRYLFVRCDNEPAPWKSDEHGDRPRPLPVIKELANAIDMTERKGSPAWDFDEQDACWKWKTPPPPSRKPVMTGNPLDKKRSRAIRKAQKMNLREKLLNEFSCTICKKVMADPVTTPCAHNFCKQCLEGAFAGKSVMRNRSKGGRTLRAQKNIMQCPRCPTDISDFLQNPQVNRDVMEVIEKLQGEIEKEAADSVEEDTDISEDNSSAAEDIETEENGPENAGAVEKPKAQAANKSPRANKKKKEDSKPNEKKKKPPARANKRRKVADNGSGSSEKPGIEDSATDGNDSPSSPLTTRSSDDDFE